MDGARVRGPPATEAAAPAIGAGRSARAPHPAGRGGACTAGRGRAAVCPGPPQPADIPLRAVAAAALTLTGVLGAVCGRRDAPAGRVRAVVARPHSDTVRFSAPARASRCAAGRGWLLQGSTGGNGVAVWVGSPPPPAPRPPLLVPRGGAAFPPGRAG